MKQGKRACATAIAVCQHERIVLESFAHFGAVEGQDLFTTYHELILDDASTIFQSMMEFCELKCSANERVEYLELEDFPGGQANKNRISKSVKVNGIEFGDETNEVLEIITNQAVWQRYKAMEKMQFVKVQLLQGNIDERKEQVAAEETVPDMIDENLLNAL